MCNRLLQKWKFAICFLLSAALTMISVYSLSAFDMSGRQIMIFDGNVKKTIRTKAGNFDDALLAGGISLGRYDSYWASTETLRDGTIIVVERAVPVTISEGGRSRKIYTTQQTVQGAVNDAGYDWQTMMPLEDGFGQVKKNMVIHVAPYTKRLSVKKEAIPVEYVRWYDEALGAGEETVMDPGRAGERAVTVEEYVSDGKVVRADVVRTEILDEGAAGALRVGSEENAAGRVMRMKATAYHPTDGDGRGITATGTKAGHGTVAVDPSVIPLGAYVYIPGYGDAVAADTGGAIVGNRIDLCMETFSECYNFGVRPVEVFVAYP